MARRRRPPGATRTLGRARRWLAGLWVLYLNYSWMVSQISGSQGAIGAFTVPVIRFYLPAMGLIALLAAWLLTRLPRLLAWALIAALAAAAVRSFNSMSAGGIDNGGAGVGAGPGGQCRSTSPGGLGASGGTLHKGQTTQGGSDWTGCRRSSRRAAAGAHLQRVSETTSNLVP